MTPAEFTRRAREGEVERRHGKLFLSKSADRADLDQNKIAPWQLRDFTNCEISQFLSTPVACRNSWHTSQMRDSPRIGPGRAIVL
jgi:hypothetical protein